MKYHQAKQLAVEALKNVSIGQQVNIVTGVGVAKNADGTWTAFSSDENGTHETVCSSIDDVIETICQALVN